MSEILISIHTLEDKKKYEEIGITNFLFAVTDFSVGYTSFSLEEIPKNAYLLINRVFDTEGIALLREQKEKIKQFRGIFFEDLGVYSLFKDTDLELVWFQNHFGTNKASLNFWLDKGCASAVLSNEITRDEIKEIVASAHKPVVLTVFGKNQVMYSRRMLLHNFNTYSKTKEVNDVLLEEKNTNTTFFARESKYGTVIHDAMYFNYLPFVEQEVLENIRYYMVLNLDLPFIEMKEILEGKTYGNEGFLDKKTVYRMSEYTDRKGEQ